jgi:probable rRNA maturation factor
MRLELAVQYAAHRRGLPHRRSVARWLLAALRRRAVITVRFVGQREVRALNAAYRGRDKATNVLSFGYTLPPAMLLARTRQELTGDIVLCGDVVKREAREQGKPARAHFAHLIVHGALHLQGYEHRTRAQAKAMEDRERAILSGLGYPDPYGK